MPRIPYIENQVDLGGPPDLALARPNQALSDTEKVLEGFAQQDAAVKGLNLLANFKVQQAKRQQILQEQAQSPDQFTDFALQDFDGNKEKLLSENDDPRVQQFLAERLPQARLEYTQSALEWEDAQRKSLRQANFGQAVATAANGINTNPATYQSTLADLDASLASKSFEPAQREAMRQAATRQYTQSYLDGLPPDQALQRLRAGEFDATLGADEKLQLDNHLDAKIREDATAGRVAQNQAQELAGLQAQVAINDYGNGVGDRPNLDVPATRAAMGDKNYLENVMRLGDADAKRAKADGAMNAVVTALSLNQKVNPNDPKLRDAVDKYFQQAVIPTLSGLPQDQQLDTVLSFADRIGVVPKSVVSSMIETPLVSGTAQQKADAAQIYARLVQNQPLYREAVNEQARRAASLINSYRAAGFDPDRAAQAADEDMKRAETRLGKGLDAEYQTKISNGKGKPTRSVQFLQSNFSEGWFSANPATQGSVVSAFDTVAEHEYATNGGNLDAAQQTALDAIKTQYGVSRVNGAPAIMRHAPEVFYGMPGLSTDQNAAWIRQQAVDDLNRDHPFVPVTGDQIKILPYVEATGRNVSGPPDADGKAKPAYALVVIGSDGVSHAQMDYTAGSPNYGKPLAWVPDTNKETVDFNSAASLRQAYNLDVARYRRDWPTLTMDQRRAKRVEILTKYGFNPRWDGPLESLTPMVRKPKDQRSEASPTNWTGEGGPNIERPNVPADYPIESQPNYGPGVRGNREPGIYDAIDINKNVQGQPMPMGDAGGTAVRRHDDQSAAAVAALDQSGLPSGLASVEQWASRGPGDTGAPVTDNANQINSLLASMAQDYERIRAAIPNAKEQGATARNRAHYFMLHMDQLDAEFERKIQEAENFQGPKWLYVMKGMLSQLPDLLPDLKRRVHDSLAGGRDLPPRPKDVPSVSGPRNV